MAALALLLVILAIYVGATLPPPAVALTTSIPPTVRFGGYHIHTNRSDGNWSADEVAAAAARAGLHFIILTDHGDATRAPDPPAYRHGVLVIDAVEISTTDGHVVALNLDKPSPYPLAGRARDVIEDIHRLGGWAVVAHPDSPKKELRWNAWDTAYDGVEWINADSEWRDEPKMRLAMSALRGMVRGPESIAALFKRPATTISRWTEELKHRPVVALGAMDAHGTFPLGTAVLRTVWQAVQLDAPLSGQAGDDARKVLETMHRGRTFTIIPAIAGPAVLEFSATQSEVTVEAGGRLDSLRGPARFHIGVPGVPEASIEFLRNDRLALPLEGVPERGAYRLEVTRSHRDLTKPFISVGPVILGLPWLFSNPIYVDEPILPGPPTPEVESSPILRTALPLDRGWGIEHAAGSSGEVAVEGAGLRFAYRLGAETRSNPYAALVTGLEGSAVFQRVEFVGRADRPTRISVQVRVPDGTAEGLRWGRSVYLDGTARTFTIALDEFAPIGDTNRPRLAANAIRSLLFVVDTVNVPSGARGTVWVSNPALWVMPPR